LLLILALVFLLGFSAISNRDWREYLKSAHLVEHTYRVLVATEELRTSIEVAETSQRNYLLTGEDRYLAPYRAALSQIAGNQAKLRGLTADNPEQLARLSALDRATAAKLTELRETIELLRPRKFEQTLRVFRMDRGEKAMEDVRRISGDVQQEEYRLLTERSAKAEAQILRTRRIGGLGFCVVLALLILATIAIERDTARRRVAEAALRDSEEQFRQVFEESPSGILLINDDLRIRRGNPAIRSLLGYEEGEIEGLTLPEITPWDSLADETQCHVDQQCVTKSGETVWVNVNATLIRDSQGRVLFHLALIEDITLRKRADETIRALNDSLEIRVEQRTQELADTNQQLAAANKELEAFAYSVSHDLRAPLRSVDCFSQIIIEEYADKLDDDGAKYLQRIRAGAKTMSQLIDDLLNLARLSRTQLNREPVHLSSIALSIVNEWRDREPDRVMKAAIAPDVQAPGDARLLRVVLDNLLGNAWKFTGKRENACLEFGAVNQRGQTVYFIRDNGAGFDMAYSSQLFAPFQRLHQATEFEGSGIGLATVQRIIQRHGGSIWAEGSVGQGATFYFTLVGGANGHSEEKT